MIESALTVGAYPATGASGGGWGSRAQEAPPHAERSARKNTRGNAIPRGDGMDLRRDASGMFGIIGRGGWNVKGKTFWQMAGSFGYVRRVKLEKRYSKQMPSLF